MHPSHVDLNPKRSRRLGADALGTDDPELPEGPPKLSTSSWTLRFIVLFLGVCVLFVARRPDSITNPQFWAEDGSLLFKGQILQGGVAWLFDPYRGYLIINTKLLALLAGLVPVLYTPLTYNLFAILLASLACSFFALPAYRSLIRSDVLRVAVCLALVGAIYTDSLVDNLCNSQWYLALLAFLILFKDPLQGKKPWIAAISATVVGLATLTNPVMAVAGPICLWKIVRKRNIAVAATLLVCLGIQICFFLRFPAEPKESAQPATLAFAVIVATIYKVVISTVAGAPAVVAASNANTSICFYLISTATGAWLIWLLLRLEARKRLHALGACYVGIAVVALALNGRGFFRAYSTPTHITEFRAEHYFFISGCVLLYLLALTAEQVPSKSWRYAPVAAFCLTVAGGLYNNFEVVPFVDFQWATQAKQVQLWAEKARILPTLCAPINPTGWFLPFPDSFQEVTVSGFPNHVVATPSGDYMAVAIDPALVHNSGDVDYVYLPLYLGIRTRYHAQATVEANGSAVVSLMIHGILDRGTFVQTAPTPVGSVGQIGADVLTDTDGRLCFHLAHISGGAVRFRTINLRHL